MKRFSPLFHVLGFLRDVRQANVLEAAALGHDAIVERDVGTTSAHLMNLKPLGGLAADVEAFAIALGSEKHVICHAGVYGLREGCVQIDAGRTVQELPSAGILEPVLRGLRRVDRHLLRARWYCAADRPTAHQIATAIDIASRQAAAISCEDGCVARNVVVYGE